MSYAIYDKQGGLKCEVHKLEYEGTWLGERKLTISVETDTPIVWANGDYLDYRGERFTLRYLPGIVKNMLSGNHRYKYDNIIFNACGDELTRCDFRDVTLEDNNIHYTSLPNFSFYCATAQDFADRLQANLDTLYQGAQKWTVNVVSGTTIKSKTLSYNGVKCWEALTGIKNDLGLNFFIEGRTITIGDVVETVPHEFRLGKGNGLVELQLSSESNADIITRLRAYGSTRNLPYRYYNNLWKRGEEIRYSVNDLTNEGYVKIISESMYMPNLMLPMFVYPDKIGTVVNGVKLEGELYHNAYLESIQGTADYGTNEGHVFFDGQNDNKDIYPTIEDMTADELRELQFATTATGYVDEIVSCQGITDNGVVPEGGTISGTFKIKIKDIGFDINDYLTQEPAQIGFKTGACAGREFVIVSCERVSGGYLLTCNRETDSGLNIAFPNTDYLPHSGDKFILLHIYMPEPYIRVAENRLLNEAINYIKENDHTKFTFTPAIDNIMLARNPELANALKEGKQFMIYDSELGVSANISINTLKISEGNSLIPEYEITISEENEVSLVQRVTSGVADNLKRDPQLLGMSPDVVRATGDNRYLRKDANDTAKGKIDFKEGIGISDRYGFTKEGDITAKSLTAPESVTTDNITSQNFAGGALGSGFSIRTDSNGTSMELDNLRVRKDFKVSTMVLQEIKSVGGVIVVSHANGVIEKVTEWASGNGYDITLKDADKNPPFVQNDLVRCKRWKGSNYSEYWVRVSGYNQQTKSYSFLKSEFGGVMPLEGDNLVQMGNTTNTNRQGFIVISATDSKPVIDIYDGINTPALTTDKFKARLGSLKDVVWNGQSLDGYGLFSNNAYLKGKFEIHTPDGDRDLEQTVTDLIIDADGLHSQVNGISVTGANLVDGSDKLALGYWGGGTWIPGNEQPEGDEIHVHQTPQGIMVTPEPGLTECWHNWWWSDKKNLEGLDGLKTGEKVTISFDMLCTFPTEIGADPLKTRNVPRVFIGGSDHFLEFSNEITFNQWNKISETFVWDASRWSLNKEVYFDWGNTQDSMMYSTFTIARWKIERGAKATEWTSSKVDERKNISTEIDQKDNEIILAVGESGLNLTDKSITLKSANTMVKSATGKTVAAFTEDANGVALNAENINVSVLKAYKGNVLKSAYNYNGDGTIVYFYPNGKPMKADAFIYDSQGNVTGLRSTYYDADGYVSWYTDQNGYQKVLDTYWSNIHKPFCATEQELVAICEQYKMGNMPDNGNIYSVFSQYHTIAGSNKAEWNGFTVQGYEDNADPITLTGYDGYIFTTPRRLTDKEYESDTEVRYYYEAGFYVLGNLQKRVRVYLYFEGDFTSNTFLRSEVVTSTDTANLMI